ncbi:hypothetical protein [Streptomyces massasporeus]|uniref:hypothetical protein n=1 Tax=Streptomyces massasporeus TaxID=67324 RepID=UPI00380A21FF
MGRLSQRVAMVTGGAGGIGSAVARALGRRRLGGDRGHPVTDATFSTGCEFIVDGGILAEASAVLAPDD